jgi:hypothetical protein
VTGVQTCALPILQCDVKIDLSSNLSPFVLGKKITFIGEDKNGYEVLLLLVSLYGLSFQCDSQGRIRIVEGLCKVEYIPYQSLTIESPEFTPFDPKVRTLQLLEAARRDLLKDDREIEKAEKTIRESFNQIKVNLEVTDQPLSDVLEFLRQFTNLCGVFDLDIDQTKKVTYKSQNKPLGEVLQEILGVDLAVICSGTHPEVLITSTEKAKQILEKRSRDQASRESLLAMTVSSKGGNLTAVLDRLRRLDNLPINPDREVWEKGKSVSLDDDGQPLKDFLDHATSRLGAKWLYYKGSIYMYKPTLKTRK